MSRISGSPLRLLGAALALSLGCGAPEGPLAGAEPVGAGAGALITDVTAHLTWANSWLATAQADPGSVAENLYDSQPSYISMSGGVLKNRSVCSSLVVQLLRNAHGLADADFRNSFPRRLDQGRCDVGALKYSDGSAYDGQSHGTTGPNSAQFHYKIERCANIGPIRFTKIDRVPDIQPGDLLAVRYLQPSGDSSGHNMVARAAPTTAPVHPVTRLPVTLPAGPAGSVAYAVEIIDSTRSNHGNGTILPDVRPGAVNNSGGAGVGYFVLYADPATQAIVASRWSVNAADLDLVDTHPINVGRLQLQ